VTWMRVTKFDARALALADRHYSRQRRGSRQFMPPGKTLVLLTPDANAVFGVCSNLDPRGREQFRCTIFRNESELLSSDLVRAASAIAAEWALDNGVIATLTTEIDPKLVRRKRDPGRCFRRAGWYVVGASRGHRHRGGIVLAAPLEVAP